MSLADRTPPSAAEYENYRERFSNWGRWGDLDELGTLNHITPEARRAAAALVSEGRSLSLSRPIDTHAGPANPFPAHHFIAVGESGGLMDYLGLFIHGFVNTHVDALCHLPTADGRHFYNGSPVGHSGLPTTRTGTVEHWRDGIVARGVLYDVPRLRGAKYVERGEPVHAWDLADCAAAQGIEPRAGDAVLVRSGAAPYFAAHPGSHGVTGGPGLHASALEFLFETDAALLGWDHLDAATEDQGLPNPMAIPTPVHVHQIALPYMGMPLLDNCDLEGVAAECERLGRWEFQLVIAPLVLEGATGSPVNPIALF